MNISSIFFPQQSRSFKGQRWVNIIMRSIHLMGISGVGAAFLYDIPNEQWLPFMILTVTSGSIMIMLETWNNGIWLIQLRGISTLIKLVLLSTTFFVGMNAYILLIIILISGVMSHAPGKVRYYPVIKIND